MGKQDFNKGMEAGAKPFEEKFQKLSEDNRKIGDKVNEKLDSFGNIIDAVMDDLSDMQKNELYHLNTPYDLKEDLDDDEKEILAALLLRLSEYTENNEFQKKFMRSVNAYIEVKSPQTGLDISCIENIENITSQKIILQAAMEYLYLMTGDFSFLEELEAEVFEHFSVNRKAIREIEEYIQTIDQATGKDGIAEKYGYVLEEKTREGTIDEDTFKLYQETTPYDLMTDISEEEAHVLGGLLSKLAADEANEYQKMFLSMLEDKAEMSLNPEDNEEINLDLLENMDSQKIILQVLMEYGFLGTGNFDFIEKEIFDDFSVNKRGVRQIKDCIQKVYDLKGYEGIIEKYKYMGVEEEGKEEGNIKKFSEYNGDDISEACADQVNIHHHYAVLDDYLVYVEERKKNIVRVRKSNGESEIIDIGLDLGSIGLLDTESFSASNMCGSGNKIYIFIKIHEWKLYCIDVECYKKTTIEIMFDGSDWDKEHFSEWSPQCNNKALVYCTKTGGEESKGSIAIIDLKDNTRKPLTLEDTSSEGIGNIGTQFMLVDDDIYLAYKDTLYAYHLNSEELESLCNLRNEGYYFLKNDSFYISQTGRYQNQLITVVAGQSGDYSEGIKFLIVDLLNPKQVVATGLSGNQAAVGFVFYDSVYCITCDEDASIIRYNLETGKETILCGETKCSDAVTEGLIRKRTHYIVTFQKTLPQVVGKWLYYKIDEVSAQGRRDEINKLNIEKSNGKPVCIIDK